jgi:hypothetical protein
MDKTMNNKPYKKSIAIAVLTACLGLASTAQAGIVTDSFTNDFVTTEINQAGSLDKFDGSLGTLNSAVLTLSGDSLSHTELENTAANSQFFSFESVLNFFFDASSVGVTVPAEAFRTDLGDTDGFVTLAAGAVLNLGDSIDTGTFSVEITGAALNAFIGVGTFNTSCNTLSGSNFTGGGGNIVVSQTTTARCLGDIVYDFTAFTPPPVSASSPATFLLLGAGLLGLAGTRRFLK